jgi:hypothetical protein
VCLGGDGLDHLQRNEALGRLGALFASFGPDALAHLAASDQHVRGDGGALVYLLETPDGSLLYQDTSGHWSGVLNGLRPDVAILAAAGRGNVDGEPVQGSLAEFIAAEAAALRPGKVVLGHHDNWLPGFSVDLDVSPIVKRIPVPVLHEGYVESWPIFR